RSPYPVVIINDRGGQALIPSDMLQPCESHKAQDTLWNYRNLPFSYWVSSEGSGSGALRITLQNETDGRLLYRGLLDGSEHQLGVLAPRERINLSVTLDLPKDHGPVPANVTFIWTAKATVLVLWWPWMLPIIFMILAILAVSQSRRRLPTIMVRRRVA